MNETPITAEDLTLYAMHLLDVTASARVELLLRSSTEAREELATIRGDLAAFALSAPQHTPPALSRQRLLKQVARERRIVPIPVAMQDASPFVIDAPAPTVADPSLSPQRSAKSLADERRSKVRLPRIVAEPEPLFSADDHAANQISQTATPASPGFAEPVARSAPPTAKPQGSTQDTVRPLGQRTSSYA